MEFNSVVKLVEFNLEKYNILTIEEISNLSDAKLSIVLMKSEDKMGSIELLKDGICDFLIVDYKSENVLFSETLKINDLNAFENEMIKFLELLEKSPERS